MLLVLLFGAQTSFSMPSMLLEASRRLDSTEWELKLRNLVLMIQGKDERQKNFIYIYINRPPHRIYLLNIQSTVATRLLFFNQYHRRSVIIGIPL